MTSELTTDPNEEMRVVVATVIAVLPEFHQAELKDADGYRYALTEMTPGIRIADLCEGQQYRCTVMVKYPRVLKAEVCPA